MLGIYLASVVLHDMSILNALNHPDSNTDEKSWHHHALPLSRMGKIHIYKKKKNLTS